MGLHNLTETIQRNVGESLGGLRLILLQSWGAAMLEAARAKALVSAASALAQPSGPRRLGSGPPRGRSVGCGCSPPPLFPSSLLPSSPPPLHFKCNYASAYSRVRGRVALLRPKSEYLLTQDSYLKKLKNTKTEPSPKPCPTCRSRRLLRTVVLTLPET